jgi:hypothetical protein
VTRTTRIDRPTDPLVHRNMSERVAFTGFVLKRGLDP